LAAIFHKKILLGSPASTKRDLLDRLGDRDTVRGKGSFMNLNLTGGLTDKRKKKKTEDDDL